MPMPSARDAAADRPLQRVVALLFACVLACLVVACKPVAPGSGAPGADGTAGSVDSPVLFPPDQDGERTWAGLLPCSDCQGVDTRLVLRMHDGKRNYLLTETYLGGKGPQRFNRAGDWRELRVAFDGQAATVFQLDPQQSGQQYAVQPDGALELLDGNGRPPADGVAYRLQRL